jgi:ATP-dependent exoDNAse (exonuclease V) alpha subunit
MTTATSKLKFPPLTGEQQSAITALLKGLKEKKPRQTLGGYAGTGKTTVIRALKELLPTCSVCAFTGKAASILRRKGVEASTIHSLIYEAKENKDTGKITFVRRLFLPCKSVVVDEASMVGREIHNDLLSFGLPVVFVGDHGQLEPVNSDFNLMKDPDLRLETVHRNAGEISRFSEWIRNGHDPTRFPCEETHQVEFVRKVEVKDRNLWSVADQIICAYNSTRVAANARVRELQGRGATKLTDGERVMCLRNCRSLGVYNGMQGVVKRHEWLGDRYVVDLDSYGEMLHSIPVHPDQFGKEKPPPFQIPRVNGQAKTPGAEQEERGRRDDRIPFDYSYCITCHKAQGDEFDKVLVLEQVCRRWDHVRWAYTAASRAREKVYWVQGF